jgi:SAM-dependent methyltransferase
MTKPKKQSPGTDYRGLADAYAAHRRVHPGVFDRLAAAAGRTASRLVEIGCGTANYPSALQGERVGIDPSLEMLARGRKQDAAIRLIQARAESIPLTNDSCDLVYSVDVIHHVVDRQAAYADIHRVLRPAGKVCTVTDSEWMIRNREPQSVYFPETVEVELRRYPSIESLQAEMRDAGFSALHKEAVEYQYAVTDATAYREKVFSSLLFISDEAFAGGLDRLEAALTRGPVRGISRYVLLWGTKGSR